MATSQQRAEAYTEKLKDILLNPHDEEMKVIALVIEHAIVEEQQRCIDIAQRQPIWANDGGYLAQTDMRARIVEALATRNEE